MNSNTPAANASLRVFNQGMQNVADSQKTSEDALTDIVHSVYSNSTGHVPTAAPQNSHATYDVTSGHKPVKGGF